MNKITTNLNCKYKDCGEPIHITSFGKWNEGRTSGTPSGTELHVVGKCEEGHLAEMIVRDHSGTLDISLAFFPATIAEPKEYLL